MDGGEMGKASEPMAYKVLGMADVSRRFSWRLWISIRFISRIISRTV